MLRLREALSRLSPLFMPFVISSSEFVSDLNRFVTDLRRSDETLQPS